MSLVFIPCPGKKLKSWIFTEKLAIANWKTQAKFNQICQNCRLVLQLAGKQWGKKGKLNKSVAIMDVRIQPYCLFGQYAAVNFWNVLRFPAGRVRLPNNSCDETRPPRKQI
ncbi:MAG: hypothetical protein LC660_17115 [Desulfobacteraceae bacterium]|nr:hypothetical protein [Desulfobacteraceae bacterium]